LPADGISMTGRWPECSPLAARGRLGQPWLDGILAWPAGHEVTARGRLANERTEAESAAPSRSFKDFPMNVRLATLLVAALTCTVAAGSALAQEAVASSSGTAMSHDSMKHDSMKHDAMKADSMKHDSMKHDSMKKDEAAMHSGA
jgi:pentapeptide MXKDX repeat protein